MPSPGNMERLVREKFGETLAEGIPRLLDKYKSPFKVAIEIGVYPNAVREWLLRNGYSFVDGEWTKTDEVVGYAE